MYPFFRKILIIHHAPQRALDIYAPRIDSVPCICIPVCSIRTNVSPFPKANPYPAAPRSPRSPFQALKSIATIFRFAYYAVLRFAKLWECHLHATFPLTCINIYYNFAVASLLFIKFIINL